MGNLMEPMSHVDQNCTTAYQMDGYRLGLCVFEMSVDAVILGSSVLFAKLMLSITSFSTTMKVLFLNMLLAAFGIASTRLFILVPQYISINQLFPAVFVAPIQVIHDICINVNTLITMAITLECMIYSFRPDPKKATTIFLCSVNTFWPWFTTSTMYWLEQRGVIETVPQFVVLEVLNLLSWAIFLLLYFFNRKRYKTVWASSLEEKYEITVKIRVLRTLLFLAALTTGRNFFTMTLLIIIITYVQPHCLYYIYLYCNHAYDITVALYSLLFIVPLIVSHSEFQKQFKKFVFGARKPSSTGGNTVPSLAVITEYNHNHQQPASHRPDQLRTALGETLIVPNSPNTYYRQLAASWEQMAPRGAKPQQNLQRTRPFNRAKKATQRVRDLLIWRRGRVSMDGEVGTMAGNGDAYQQRRESRTLSLGDRRASRMVDVEIPSNSTLSLRRATISPMPSPNLQRTNTLGHIPLPLTQTTTRTSSF